jgi:hypothetical protein
MAGCADYPGYAEWPVITVLPVVRVLTGSRLTFVTARETIQLLG